MHDAVIYEAIRTPRGRGKQNGSLHEVKPIDLVVGLLKEVQRRNPSLDPHELQDVVLGCVSPTGEQGGNIAKTAALAAGLPDTVAGVQLNRFCASGLEAVNQAAQRVRCGWEDLIVAGGVESMSRVPMGSDGGPWTQDPATSLATNFVPQGVGADLLATVEGFSRTDTDTFAAESQARAGQAIADGHFDDSVVPVFDRNGLPILDHDEHVRQGTTVASLSDLSPSFAGIGEAGFDAVALETYHWVDRIDHVHHAGNSSGIVDGAGVVLVGSADAGERNGLTPRARIRSTAVTGSEPTIMLSGPGPASLLALNRAGLTPSDIDLVEINEAFAAVPLKLMRDLGDYPRDQTNVNGGAIAMGHPLGATGAMILGTLVDELERRDLRFGLATLCVGGGMGIATVVERTNP